MLKPLSVSKTILVDDRETKRSMRASKEQKKILIMDDEEIIRDVGSKLLQYLGFDVALAKDGDEAIKMYKEAHDAGSPIDLIIMDLTVPGGMGGKDAVREILALDSEAKVIVSSGFFNDPVMENYHDYGFKGKIMKPFDLNDLGEGVKALL
jgi:CheY-like chemotaxis protein